MIQNASIVRRTDLRLRCDYIGLETEIYELSPYDHVIYCKNVQGDFNELYRHFNYSIRPVAHKIELTQEIPETYRVQLQPISFSDVVDSFKGSYLTQYDMETAIVDRFPDVDIVSIEVVTGIDFSITILVSPDTPTETIEKMELVLAGIDFGTDQLMIHRALEGTSLKATFHRPNEVMLLRSDRQLPFTLVEADDWHEKAPGIYRGELTRADFLKYSPDSTACFLDSFGSDCTDLRSMLLLYETIYLALPLEGHFEKFLSKQNLTKRELLQLVEMGRIVLVLSNLESRYDTQFLMDAYHVNPLAIIGRRGINTLVAAYLAEIRARFTSHFPTAMEAATEMYARYRLDGDPMMTVMAHILSWPVIGFANSFDRLNRHGPLSMGVMGLDQIWQPSFCHLDKDAAENIKFVLSLEGHKAFIASALNATLFSAPEDEHPGSERPFQIVNNAVSDLLQVYWYDIDALGSIGEMRKKTYEEQQVIHLFDCRKNISISKVIDLANQYHTQEDFRQLLLDLEKMDETDRCKRITQYNDVLAELASVKAPTSKLDFLLSSSSFLPLPYILSLILAIIGAVKGPISRIGSIKDTAECERIEVAIQAAGLKVDTRFTEEVYLLDKISRVVNLR